MGKLRQVIQKDDGSPACAAVPTIALWDIDARKLLFPTERWLAAVGADLTQVECPDSRTWRVGSCSVV